MKPIILGMVRAAQLDLQEHVKPRDDFEVAVVAALGEISWDEAIAAIAKHRAAQAQIEEHAPSP